MTRLGTGVALICAALGWGACYGDDARLDERNAHYAVGLDALLVEDVYASDAIDPDDAEVYDDNDTYVEADVRPVDDADIGDADGDSWDDNDTYVDPDAMVDIVDDADSDGGETDAADAEDSLDAADIGDGSDGDADGSDGEADAEDSLDAADIDDGSDTDEDGSDTDEDGSDGGEDGSDTDDDGSDTGEDGSDTDDNGSDTDEDGSDGGDTDDDTADTEGDTSDTADTADVADTYDAVDTYDIYDTGPDACVETASLDLSGVDHDDFIACNFHDQCPDGDGCNALGFCGPTSCHDPDFDTGAEGWPELSSEEDIEDFCLENPGMGYTAVLDCSSTPATCPCKPAEPPCTAQLANQGGLRLGRCHWMCVEDSYRWSFWVTQYNVGGTLGWGEHQGIGNIGYRYRTDDRFYPDGRHKTLPVANQLPALARRAWRHNTTGRLWAQGMNVTQPRQFEMRTTNPGGETTADVPVSRASVIDDHFMCDHHVKTLDQRFYNHGRTLAERVPSDRWYRTRNLIPLRLLERIIVNIPPLGTVARRADFDNAITRVADTSAALRISKDGFCDSVCGNCSYVIPNAGQGGTFANAEPGGQIAPGQTTRTWANVLQLPPARAGWVNIEGVGGGIPVRYVGGSSFLNWMSWALGRWSDPFTHCYAPTAPYRTQASFFDSTARTRRVTGRYGHNSNTDADAELLQFRAARTNPVRAKNLGLVTSVGACTTCGRPAIRGAAAEQWPCISRTNTAMTWWTPTSGIHNVDDLGVGHANRNGPPMAGGAPAPGAWAALPKPNCVWVGRPVYGM